MAATAALSFPLLVFSSSFSWHFPECRAFRARKGREEEKEERQERKGREKEEEKCQERKGKERKEQERKKPSLPRAQSFG